MRHSLTSTKPDARSEDRPGAIYSQTMRLFWLCLTLALLAFAILVWFFGLTWWTFLIGVVVIGCPVVVTWIVLGGFD